MDASKGKADVLVEKHRHGPTSKVTLAFDSMFTRFRDLPDDYVRVATPSDPT